MTFKKGFKRGWTILANTDRAFEELPGRSLEEVIEEYMKVLLVMGIVAGVFSLIAAFAEAAYLDVFRGVTVDYLRLANYSLSFAAGRFFVYLFGGTFGLGFVSLIVKLIVPRVPYKHVMAILLYSALPVLLLGWITSTLIPALLLWSLFLLIRGRRMYWKRAKKK